MIRVSLSLIGDYSQGHRPSTNRDRGTGSRWLPVISLSDNRAPSPLRITDMGLAVIGLSLNSHGTGCLPGRRPGFLLVRKITVVGEVV